MASGECAYRPTIHIWSTKTLETIRIIQTVHRWGIIELATEDNILLSYGFVSRPEQSEDIQLNYSNINTFSYQLTNYVTGEVLGTRTEKDIVHAMAINPVTRTEFATCS